MSDSFTVVGIDPGIYGAICFLKQSDGRDTFQLVQMPLIETKKGRYDLDLNKLFNVFFPIPVDLVCIEDPPVIPVNSSLAIKSLFKNYGELRGLVIGMGRKLFCPPSKSWKAEVLPHTSKDKEAAIAFTQVNFPQIQLPPHPKHPKKLHDGIADAICIAEYAKRHYLKTHGQ